MLAASDMGLRAIEAYRSACGTRPLLERRGRAGTGVSLYHWNLDPTRDVRIPPTREITLAVHLGGVQEVRVFTDRGVSRQFSRPGDLTLIPRRQSIHYLIEGSVEFATVHLPERAARLFDDQSNGGLLGLPGCLFAFRDDYTLASVRALMQSATSGYAPSDLYVTQMLDALALHLSRVVTQGSAEPVTLADDEPSPSIPGSAFDFSTFAAAVDDRLDDRLTLRSLSQIAGVGRTTLCELLRAHRGTSPHRYVLERRIERAREMFENGRRNITDVSFELGFSSAAHFSTAFKRSTGMQPRQYIEAVRALARTLSPHADTPDRRRH